MGGFGGWRRCGQGGLRGGKERLIWGGWCSWEPNGGRLSIDFIETEHALVLLMVFVSAASDGSEFLSSGVCLVGGRGVWSGGA